MNNRVLYIKDETKEYDFISWKSICLNSQYDEIKQENNFELLILVKFYDDFFEVICGSLQFNMKFDSSMSYKYLSHKLSKEMMEYLFAEAINLPNENLYVCKIKRLEPPSECKIMQLYPMENTYDREGLEPGYPQWSANEDQKELSCSIIINNTSLEFLFSKDDFTPRYISDRDGGWLIYTHEQHVVGLLKFPSIYELQGFLLNLCSNKECKPYFSQSDIFQIRIPFQYHTKLGIFCSVSKFFKTLDIRDEGTIYKTYEEGAYELEDNYLTSYDHGGTRGIWYSNGWEYPSEVKLVRKSYHGFSLIWKYTKISHLYKELSFMYQ